MSIKYDTVLVHPGGSLTLSDKVAFLAESFLNDKAVATSLNVAVSPSYEEFADYLFFDNSLAVEALEEFQMIIKKLENYVSLEDTADVEFLKGLIEKIYTEQRKKFEGE